MPKAHPLIRVVLFVVLYIVGTFAVQLIGLLVLSALPGGPNLIEDEQLLAGRIPIGLFLLLSWPGFLYNLGLTAAFHAWARVDPLLGLRLRGARLGRELLAGLALGLGSMVVIAAVFVALGWASFSAASSPGMGLNLLIAFLALLPAAASEEIVFRGYLLPTLESWRGWWVGVVGSSVLFGLAHGANPNFSFIALANIVLAGVAFALAYRLTRRLWLPIAYHLMWNFAQGPLLGFEVSGLSFASVAHASVTGPAMWTGGAFGPEGGLIVTLLLLLTCAGLEWWKRAGGGREQRLEIGD